MGQRAPRLYRKSSGVYWMRIVLPRHAQPSAIVTDRDAPSTTASDQDSLPKPSGDRSASANTVAASRNRQNRIEFRRSLYTTDFKLANSISSVINALLSQAPKKHWKTIVEHLFSSKNISSWTAGPNGISVDGPDDQRGLQEFLSTYGDMRKAIAAALGSGFKDASTSPAPSAETDLDLPSSAFSIPAYTGMAGSEPKSVGQNPLRVSDVIRLFVERAQESGKERTAHDQVRLVRKFIAYLGTQKPALGDDPWAHDIGTYDISAFIDAQKKRTGKGVDGEGKSKFLSASTLRKQILDFGVFFEYARDELKACHENPASGLKKRAKQLGEVASVEQEPYLPFTDAHIELIFEPTGYLARNRDADYFWCPLLGLFLGGRLGEFVRTRMSDIGQDSTGIWYIDITEAKNNNSVRRLPLPTALIDLGFIEYVMHVRALGATFLWPHRDLTSPTARRLPSKNQSKAFGDHLTKVGLTDPRLVFHSFRHTVVSALLDGGTPVHLSMQIVGHEAQATAVKKELIKESATRSVHLGTYSHPSEVRMGTTRPLQSMKAALERCIQPPIDYTRLRLAAQIVLEHTRKVGKAFTTGWPAQRADYTAKQLARLESPAQQEGEGT